MTWFWQPLIPQGVTEITGTAALAVTQPGIAASGTFTAPPITGTAALAVTQPAIAGSGTFTPFAVTGTAALTVPQPQIAASGTVPVTNPPAVGGRPHGRKRAVVHRYPERRPRFVLPEGLELVPAYNGEGAIGVRPPQIRASGVVETLAEKEADERFFARAAIDDEDLVLALEIADTWL